MKKIETFIAEDGTKFDDEKSCVEHEFKTIDGLVDKINLMLDKKMGSHQLNWCESGACCCVGCANHEFHTLGLTKAHWEVWVEKYREPRLDDEDNNYSDDISYELHLENKNVPKANLIKYLKEQYQFRELNFLEIGKKIDSSIKENKSLISSRWYDDIAKIKNKLSEEFGVNSVIKRNGKDIEEARFLRSLDKNKEAFSAEAVVKRSNKFK